MSILGVHHVTATVAGAQEDLDFATGALGLRLVKKTVNFDDHGVYHFYYGNETAPRGRYGPCSPIMTGACRLARRGWVRSR